MQSAVDWMVEQIDDQTESEHGTPSTGIQLITEWECVPFLCSMSVRGSNKAKYGDMLQVVCNMM